MTEAARNRAMSKWLFWLIPLVLAVLIMIPRLRSAQFGFLDDVNTLRESQSVVAGEWDATNESGSGRYRPVYWLYYGTIYRISGANPESFFLGNLAMLAWITAGLVLLAYAGTGSYLIACLAGVLFVASGPIAESAYTLSKGELHQLSWIVLSLLIIGTLPRASESWQRYLATGLAAAALLAATASKETSVVMAPVAIAWFLVSATMGSRLGVGGKRLGAKGYYAIAALLGNLAYFVWRASAMPVGLGHNSYASNYHFDVDRIIHSALGWLDWLNRDFLYLAPLLLLAAWLAIRGRRLHSPALLLVGLIWMAGWLGFFLPWPYQLEYYLLPFSLGASMVGAILLVRVVRELAHARGAAKALIALGLAATLALFTSTIPNNIGNAKLQLTVDRVNAEAQRYLADSLPHGSRLILNMPLPNQYVYGIGDILVESEGRGDIDLDVYRPREDDPDGDGAMHTFLMSPRMENQFNPSVRLGFHEHTAKKWHEIMLEERGGEMQLVASIRGGFRSTAIDAPRLFCPLAPNWKYCDVPNAPFDFRYVSYGWDIYELKGSG